MNLILVLALVPPELFAIIGEGFGSTAPTRFDGGLYDGTNKEGRD